MVVVNEVAVADLEMVEIDLRGRGCRLRCQSRVSSLSDDQVISQFRADYLQVDARLVHRHRLDVVITVAANYRPEAYVHTGRLSRQQRQAGESIDAGDHQIIHRQVHIRETAQKTQVNIPELHLRVQLVVDAGFYVLDDLVLKQNRRQQQRTDQQDYEDN